MKTIINVNSGTGNSRKKHADILELQCGRFRGDLRNGQVSDDRADFLAERNGNGQEMPSYRETDGKTPLTAGSDRANFV